MAFRARSSAADVTLARLAPYSVEPHRARGLDPAHPALRDGRTVYPSTVKAPDAHRLLVSGHNNAKLGAAVRKGPWKGFPIYHLTLEERATCPRSCAVWDLCYGNAMHLARRHDHTHPWFLPMLEAELWLLQREHPKGFVVRLHTLGDFYSVDYVKFWARMLDALPALRVFGYSANRPDAEDETERAIGAALQALAGAAFDVFAVRFSGRDGPGGTIVVDSDPGRAGVIVCPAQTHATAACATCGLCWAPAAQAHTIAFLKHGMKDTSGPRSGRPPKHRSPERGGAATQPVKARRIPVAAARRADPPASGPSPMRTGAGGGDGAGGGGRFRDQVTRVAPASPYQPRPYGKTSRISISDAERRALVAAYLAEKAPTQCPPGFAWGAEPSFQLTGGPGKHIAMKVLV